MGVPEFHQWRKYGGFLQFVTEGGKLRLLAPHLVRPCVTEEYKCRIHVRTEDVSIYVIAFSY